MHSKSAIERLQWFERLAHQHIVTQSINDPEYGQKNVTWDILRTDLIHPVCSGNKFFKLKYYLLDALQKNHTHLATYGGPWSNHIVATAFAARHCGMASTGFIRGEEPREWSDTLNQAKKEGMQLEFLSRAAYADHHPALDKESPPYIIPPGGYGSLGVKGAAEILNFAQKDIYTHICCASGTGTMLAGLIKASNSRQHCLGIAVLYDAAMEKNVAALNNSAGQTRCSLNHDYHFGGYAKKTDELISFMNKFYESYCIPTDFVYTGKLMFAIRALIRDDYFPQGSKILAIHSGGLQGNKSLKKGTLLF